MIAFEEPMIELTRQQQNLSALRHPQVGDRWLERGFQPAGVVRAVIFGRYVMVDLQSKPEIKYWSLAEYANHFKYKSMDATWADVERSPHPLTNRDALKQILYFFHRRWQQQWQALKGPFPKTFNILGLKVTLERTKR
ncbi:hypothetical protein [Xanthomonas phage RTH11]|nr:hypothetical protein [Xanthomonas phage RTH11]